MITLLANTKGQLYACSQMQDYIFRGKEMELCSLLAFSIDTWEETFTSESDQPLQTAEATQTKAGRPAHLHAQYLQPHPKCLTHCRVLRAQNHNTLPQIAGPWFPRHNNADTHDFYCACMLALLKPWHNKEDLKRDNQSWPEVFKTFVQNASVDHKRIIAGINYYYEMKMACNPSIAEGVEPRTGRQQDKGCTGNQEDTDTNDIDMDEARIPLTEEDLKQFQWDQLSPHEEAHGDAAIQIVLARGFFPSNTSPPQNHCDSYRFATGNDKRLLLEWLNSMHAMTQKNMKPDDAPPTSSTGSETNITKLSRALFDSEHGDTSLIADLVSKATALRAAAPNELLEDQWWAYNIIDWHLEQNLSGKCPKQLLMIIPGEAGVGKSKTIQTITENFVDRHAASILVKAAYTGLAASVIDGQTIHHVAMLPLQGGKQSARTMKALEAFWQDKQYLIIDEMSMVSCEMFAKLSSIISRVKTVINGSSTNEPFGGLNVILVGNFHQFPPVAAKPTAPLYYPSNPEKDTDNEMVGRKLYEQFEVVVRLKTQVWVTDPHWLDVLQHIWHGNCSDEHITTLRELVLSHDRCPVTDFTSEPWSKALLVTPRHAVEMKWNSMCAKVHSFAQGLSLINCPAFDTIQGRVLTLEEKFAVAAKPKTGRGRNHHERAGLADEVDIVIGMEVMVTFNISTDLDVANGAHGHIEDIILDAREEMSTLSSLTKVLQYPPLYILVRMIRTKADPLPGLETGVLPITPLMRTFSVTTSSGNKVTVTRQQLPVTPAYAFTDYCSQAQTIEHCIIDLGTPLTGKLTPFNAYVALSHSRGRNTVRLLRDFNEHLFTHHPSEHLWIEDERLDVLDKRSKEKWQEAITQRALT